MAWEGCPEPDAPCKLRAATAAEHDDSRSPSPEPIIDSDAPNSPTLSTQAPPASPTTVMPNTKLAKAPGAPKKVCNV